MTMFPRKTGQSAFSLVELMVVVAIIGILAALAVPRFQTFQAKAKQSEAKNNLSHIYTLQETYFGDWDNYGVSTTVIGFLPQGMVRYMYTTTGGATFLATAAALSNTSISSACTFADTWTINQNKNLIVTMDCGM